LNIKQKKLYNIVVNYYFQELALNILFSFQLFLNINNIARSEKTFIFLKTCTRIQELARKTRKQNLVFQAALTSIAIFNIIRKILYSLLYFLVKKKKLDLLITILQFLQAFFQDCKFFIIDKKLIIDIKILFLINN
jgi:hypothetical protein